MSSARHRAWPGHFECLYPKCMILAPVWVEHRAQKATSDPRPMNGDVWGHWGSLSPEAEGQAGLTAALCFFLPEQRARRAVLPPEEGSAAGPLPPYVGNKEGGSWQRGCGGHPCAPFACHSPCCAHLQMRAG